MSKAEDILLVLNELEPIDLDELKFCVITGGSRHMVGQGRMAGQIIELPEGEENYWPFEKGEILVTHEYGREPFGEGRKPGKWSTSEEYFDTLAEAMARRDQVLGTKETA